MGQREQNFISIESGVNQQGKPFCRVLVDGEPFGQLDPVEVRTMALYWLEVAEAAEMDALVFAELAELGLDVKVRAGFINSLRKRRDPR